MSEEKPVEFIDVLEDIASRSDSKGVEEQEEQVAESLDERLEDAETQNLFGDGGGYERAMPQTDIGKEIELVNFQHPFKLEDGEIIDGEVPPEALFEFWGFMHPKNALTRVDRRDYELGLLDMNIAEMSYRMANTRESFTPEKNNMLDNIQHFFRVHAASGIDGFERKTTKEVGYRESKKVGLKRSKESGDKRGFWEGMKHG